MSGSGANYNNNTPSGDIGSWIAVIICLAFIPPLGILLLLRKIFMSTKSRSSTYNPGGRYQQKYQPYNRPGTAGNAGAYRQYQPGQQPWQKQQPGAGAAAQQPFKPGSAPAGRQSYYNQNAAAGQPYYKPGPPQAARQAGAYARQNAAAGRGKKKGAQDAAPGIKQTSSKNLAVALTVMAVVLGIMGIIFLSSGLSALAVSGITAANLGMSIFGGFSILSAVTSVFVRGSVLRRMRRFTKYAAVIGDRDVVSVSEISKAAGEPVRKTRKWLQAMLDSGFYGEHAYIDSSLDSFVKSLAAAEKARGATGSADKAEKEKQASAENQYVAIVNELHMLCSQTSDPAICAKIERIESLTVKIFKIVEENPGKSPQIRRFMNYYLPTTLKLLHSYQTLERQDVAGENITSAKNDIERILDTLASGFEQQLDNLFKADKLDISADIDVIENLMEQDGLTGEGIMRTAGGN